MKIIPVLDLMKGRVVHAVKGERERYRPVESVLASSADPVDIAGGLQMETGCQAIYIADLDAIQGNGHNKGPIHNIAAHIDAELWVDAGTSDAESANRLLAAGADIAIIGSETLTGLGQLRRILASISLEKLIFSLDISNGRVLSETGFLKNLDPLIALERLTSEGLDRFILLTLDAVGTGGGSDLSFLTQAKREFPGHTLIAGGGVKTSADLQALLTTRIDGILVATSLHKGWITGHDLAAL
jgi:phosphoribosylformimino-5-aminoimidazole carboxamide ribotide isomerase